MNLPRRIASRLGLITVALVAAQGAEPAGTNDSVLIYSAGHGHIDDQTEAGPWIAVESRLPDPANAADAPQLLATQCKGQGHPPHRQTDRIGGSLGHYVPQE